jgi:hypothetical protein
MKILTVSMAILLLSVQIKVTAQPCLPEGITFSSQAEIDSFQINYPNCTEIEGDVLITGFDIANLNGLNNLTHIEGQLSIIFNNSLIDLSGLNHIMTINGGLRIINNPVLTTLTALSNLSTINGTLGISYNASLTTLSGLENLTGDIFEISISGNDALCNLAALNNITYIEEFLWISNNDNLTNLSGLNNLTSVGELLIDDNDALPDMTGLNHLTFIEDHVWIRDNDALTSLNGAENLTFIVGGFISVGENPVLVSLSALCKLKVFAITYPCLMQMFILKATPPAATVRPRWKRHVGSLKSTSSRFRVPGFGWRCGRIRPMGLSIVNCQLSIVKV